jgi:hypothetical protein
MFGKFFDTTPVDAFAAWVAKEMLQALPPERIDGEEKQTVKRREQAQERIRRHAENLASTTPLNVYQKAKLGIRVEEALVAAGYAKAFSKPFAYEVMSLVAQAASKRR